MLRRFFIFLFFLFFLTFPSIAQAKNFVSIVNPIRGPDFWSEKNQFPYTAVLGEMDILKDQNLATTWLIRFDALKDEKIVEQLISSNGEKGLFLEVTPSWTDEAYVTYHKSASWHSAGSAFLTGYSQADRIKLIDSAFERFKSIFGIYPKSVGAWYIDSFSLDYMQKKYQVLAALIVADQYTTDNYQIWGQYWSYPYYPDKKNTLIPAQNLDSKIPLVVMQWAARDPLNGYGDGVQESTYSLQANDYTDYHKLGIGYFNKLIDLFTKQKENAINQVVVGLENSYSWDKYKDEYKKQIESLANAQRKGQVILETMSGFSKEYQNNFPQTSPTQIIIADDPLGTFKKVVWFMNPYYRANWFFNNEGSVFRDIRQYISAQKEPCYDEACDLVNFATFATRVLDDVTYGQRLVIDKGRITNFSARKIDDNLILKYKNEAEKEREIKFMERDISVDGNIRSIDGIILESTTSNQTESKLQTKTNVKLFQKYKESILGFSLILGKFLSFLFLILLIPGYIFIRKLEQKSLISKVFLSITLGFVLNVLISFTLSHLRIIWIMPYLYLGLIFIFFYKKSYRDFNFTSVKLTISNLAIFLVIISGTFFQNLGMVRSGWVYDFGIGFFGPTGHDMVWHQALVEQLTKSIPPQNPVFSSQLLSNYHYFYNLLVANTEKLTQIPSPDLIYRFYPVLFSLALGLGSYILVWGMSKSKLAVLFSLYFVYFGSSFGWIVEFLREKHFGGESAFWVNQPVSANLNPPFAISLLIFSAGLILLREIQFKKEKLRFFFLPLVILWGSLIEFKVYSGILVLGALGIVSLYQLLFQKSIFVLKFFVPTLLLSLVIFLPQNSTASELLVFSPFWFVHSAIDFPDRVGWLKLSQARLAYYQRGQWLKFLLAEGLAFSIFILGNLGTRIIAFANFPKLAKSKIWKDYFYLFIFSFSLLSFLIPLIFIQKGNPWNTIQFMYYLLYIAALFSGIGLISLSKILPKLVYWILLIFTLLITPISAYTTFTSYLGKIPPATLSLLEYEGLNFLKSQPEGIVLTYPYDKKLRDKYTSPYPLFAYETTAYVAAYSGKSTFVEDELQQEILQTDYTKRLAQASEFLQGKDDNWSGKFLKENSIKYIYLPKILNVNINENEQKITRIFENDEVIIYKVLR